MLSRIAVLLASVPTVAVTLWMLSVTIAEWHDDGRDTLYLNSAEAAAAGDAARALRFLRMGDDPTRIHVIRPEVISARVQRATTVEAAMWSGHAEMVRALDREGAIVDPDQRRELACLALDLDMPEVADYLAPERTCVKGAAVARIVARSKPEAAQP
jgi:hypothetical protein